jgi:hypothetical protein
VVVGEAQPPTTAPEDYRDVACLPPPSDTGVNPRIDAQDAAAVGFGLHWLRYSFSRPFDEVREVIGGGWSDGLPGGHFNQPRHVVHESGAKLFYGSSRVEQPIVLEVPGEVCETHAGDFVRHGFALGGSCTRFDVAADIGPDDLTMRRWRELRRDFVAGRCDTRIPRTSCHFIQSKREGDGSTAYYGATSSEVFLRVYTKRGPLRMEFQISPAKRAARRAWAGQLNTFKPDEVWRHFGRKVEWPAAWYMNVLEGKAAIVDQVRDEARSFNAMMDALRLQSGSRVWMLEHLGVPLSDLSRAPTNPDGQWLADMERIAAEAEQLGHDGERLRRAARKLSKSRVKGDGRKAPPPR